MNRATAGMGFLEIQNPQRYGLKRGIETGKDTAEFGISMFHSLHCLVNNAPPLLASAAESFPTD